MSKILIDADELLRLRLAVALAPELQARGCHPAALTDVVERAVESKHFKLGVEGTLLDGGNGAVRDFVDDLHTSASFFFETEEQAANDREARQTESDAFLSLPAEKRLAIVNQRIAAERAKKKAS